MKEALVSFEVAKALKDLDFHEDVMDFYYEGKLNADGRIHNLYDDFNGEWGYDGDYQYCSAPTQNFTIDWLYKKGYIVRLNPYQDKLQVEIYDIKEGRFMARLQGGYRDKKKNINAAILVLCNQLKIRKSMRKRPKITDHIKPASEETVRELSKTLEQTTKTIKKSRKKC